MLRKFLQNIFYSFPVQLFILHFRKHQLILVFWLIVFSTLNGGFLKQYGADALFFTPEYLGGVNFFSGFFTGAAFGFFIMSWNITTFIMHSKRFRFLVATKKPFFKYCLNNSILPLTLLIFYLIRLWSFDLNKELMSVFEIVVLNTGIILGIAFTFIISLVYFFGADIRITKNISPIESRSEHLENKQENDEVLFPSELKLSYYFSGKLKLHKPRTVDHYRKDYLHFVFKQHHIAAILSMFIAFLILLLVGFFLENKFFEIPAAASIFIFFAIMIAIIGSLTYFLQSWSLIAITGFVLLLNWLYQNEMIDPRNKAYGLNYNIKSLRPEYSKASLQKICTTTRVDADKQNMLTILEKWKSRQKEEKPSIFFLNVSGGGLRSAEFVMNTLQKLDSATGGEVLNHTFLISGASGGMLAATYYRELYRLSQQDKNIKLNDSKYTDQISSDLLNPVFTSMMARDVFAPLQHFYVDSLKFVKDRGYAFEKKLSENTNNLLDIQMKDLKAAEQNGTAPLIFYNSVVKSDGRKMILSTQPISFMMKPINLMKDTSASPDAIDFNIFFEKLHPENIRTLTALRMNATFPYVLPNVWLPSNPVIDVMDAGLRDNVGQETTLRFIDNFKEWIADNTSGVVVLQFHDRMTDNWLHPFQTQSIADILLAPATMLQHNWFKFQEYFQADQLNYFQTKNISIEKIEFMYVPEKAENSATLNFHLSRREKLDIKGSFYRPYNQQSMKKVLRVLKK